MNPIITLSERVQQMYGENIETRVLSKTGPDHCPTITVEIELPNGKIYKAQGSNKREAKQIAAERALKDLNAQG